jgi:hypothetical protein
VSAGANRIGVERRRIRQAGRSVAPLAVQNIMAVWLIAKGFSPAALAAEPAGETSRWQSAASRSAA